MRSSNNGDGRSRKGNAHCLFPRALFDAPPAFFRRFPCLSDARRVLLFDTCRTRSLIHPPHFSTPPRFLRSPNEARPCSPNIRILRFQMPAFRPQRPVCLPPNSFIRKDGAGRCGVFCPVCAHARPHICAGGHKKIRFSAGASNLKRRAPRPEKTGKICLQTGKTCLYVFSLDGRQSAPRIVRAPHGRTAARHALRTKIALSPCLTRAECAAKTRPRTYNYPAPPNGTARPHGCTNARRAQKRAPPATRKALSFLSDRIGCTVKSLSAGLCPKRRRPRARGPLPRRPC